LLFCGQNLVDFSRFLDVSGSGSEMNPLPGPFHSTPAFTGSGSEKKWIVEVELEVKRPSLVVGRIVRGGFLFYGAVTEVGRPRLLYGPARTHSGPRN